MLPEKLRDENYYLDKLSMFLRSSYGLEDQLRMFITILVLVDDVIDQILAALDITNNQVFLAINEEDENKSDLLDKIAHLYGVERKFTMTYIDYDVEGHPFVTKSFDLNNFELWMLIKGQILQNQYNGTYIQSQEYYQRLGLPVVLFHSSAIGTEGVCRAFFRTNAQDTIEIEGQQFTITQQIKDMFKAGLFTIRSLGIRYEYLTTNLDFLIYRYDADMINDDPQGWDRGAWDR